MSPTDVRPVDVGTIEPVRTDDRLAILTGTGVWLVALVVTVITGGNAPDSRHRWWTWVCVAGLLLGIAGLGYLQARGRRRSSSGRLPDPAEPVHDQPGDGQR